MVLENKFWRMFKGLIARFFTFNLFWRFICEILNVVMIMLGGYFMMVCLAHGLGRLHEWHYLLIAAAFSYVFFTICGIQQRKLGKTRLKR